ncbi:hypothetical protein [Xylella fastidiosa]|nr:hypothetical protein [Xylella fastidiosa]
MCLFAFIVNAEAEGQQQDTFCISKSEGYWMRHPNRDWGNKAIG